MAGKLQVGHCLADFRYRWTAYLWAVPGKPGWGFAAEIKGADLRNLRDLVTKELADRGPWWSGSDQAATREEG
jgi:hypothetical protein